jgi:uncharacterized protein YqgQ
MVVDRLKTYAQFIIVAHPFTRKYMVEIIIREIVRMLDSQLLQYQTGIGYSLAPFRFSARRL